MLTLYFSPGASSMAAHIALHEVGVPFESRALSLPKKQNRTPEYLALNPEAKVPTLVIDGRPLTEVAGILFYLARRYPEAGLLPADDIEAEAQVVSWMSFIASTIHPARRQGVERWKLKRSPALPRGKLGGRRWVLPRYSIRRYPSVPAVLAVCYLSPHATPEAFPGLTTHFNRMMERPAVRRTCEIEAAIGYELPQ